MPSSYAHTSYCATLTVASLMMAPGRGDPNPNQFLWRLVEVEGLCDDALGHASIGHEHEESDVQEHLEDERGSVYLRLLVHLALPAGVKVGGEDGGVKMGGEDGG